MKRQSWLRTAASCMRQALRGGSMFGVLLLALSPTTMAAPSPLPEVASQTPLDFPENLSGRPSYLRTIKRRFDATQPIGEVQAGWFCNKQGDIQWNGKTAEIILPSSAMTIQFKKLLEQAHYPIPVQSDAIFEDKSNNGATKNRKDELQVGVLIKEIATNLCRKGGDGWTGGAYLKLFWQVFAPEQQKVIFETTTEGLFRTKDQPLAGTAVSTIPLQAFIAGSRNLLADPGFLKAVSTAADPALLNAPNPAKPAVGTEDSSKLLIDGISAGNEALTKKITSLRSAVVTVYADAGSGSGFFIGRSGWLLTNQHVVRQAKFVKIRLVTGRELVGEVRKTDTARDIALIKTEAAGVSPLPVRPADVAIGEDVYVLGSPLGDAFNTTLTRGILSGVREIGSQPYLQSDVAILPGSSGGPLLDKSGQVIGVTAMGLGARGVAGMNFFIPINDAISKLDVQLSRPPSHDTAQGSPAQ